MDRIGSEVERELARGGSRDALPLAAVTSVWASAVGETVARQAWPLRSGRDGTLHVATSSATWAFELDRLAPEILERLATQLAADQVPAKLRFAVGPVPEPATPTEDDLAASLTALTPTPEDVLAAEAVAAVIDDPDLRELVARAARASLAKTRSGRHF
ncbi:MAG: DciA family protein [Gaiellaceae bacterium]